MLGVSVSPAEAPPQRTGQAAWLVRDIATGQRVDAQRPEQLRQRFLPGSFMKVPALLAALSSRAIGPETGIACSREIVIDGHRIRCSHPRLRRPVRPAEAIALSCNVFFATVGRRLARSRFDGVLDALGLPPSPASAPMYLAATGLEASPATAEQLLTAFERVVRNDSDAWSASAHQVVMAGLRGAAVYGTAGAFALRKVEALAKTGTADAPGGGTLGLVLAAWPARAPARSLILLAPGAAGTNAAELAADIAAGKETAPAPAPARPADTSADDVTVGYERGGSREIRRLALDEYVAQVLAGEAAAKSPPAALEALAITVRTFAEANRRRHARDGFDFCPQTHCQVLRPATDMTRAAARATSGRVLLWRGAPAPVFYTASCGGHSEVPSAVWPGADDPPFLRVRRDRACRGEPVWSSEIPAADLERVLHAAGFRGSLRDLEIVERTASGRAGLLRLDGMIPDTIPGSRFRLAVGRALGWQLVKSAAFRVRRTGRGYRFDGHGFGHGVGLCVIGMTNRARDGESRVERLLEEYLPGLAIGSLPSSRTAALSSPQRRDQAEGGGRPPARTAPVVPPASSPPALTIDLPASSEPDREALTGFVATALDDLSRSTGLAAPPRIRLVFHPSAQSFQRETRQPWWVSAFTRENGRIDLLPLRVLQQRGTVEATLRHELAHLLTDDVLRDRPRWVREGVAMHFAGERPPQSLVGGDGMVRRVRCPSDEELEEAVSAAAARDAYARAGACVARALAEGKRWSELQ